MSNKVLEKLEEIQKELNEVKTNMAVNNEKMDNYNTSLDLHIEGTIQNREQLKIVKENLENKIVPLEKHVDAVQFLWKCIVVVGTVFAFIVGTYIAYKK